MAHSYICCHIHYIFSTKNRAKIITPELEERLWPYMGGIAREHKIKTLAIGGIEDHVHLLVSLPSTQDQNFPGRVSGVFEKAWYSI